MSKAIEQSVKEKLKNISKKEGIAFNNLLGDFFLERFLARVAKSTHKENLIFKGGMCLDQYFDIERETRDLDFLLHKIEINESKVKSIFNEISSVKSNDGIEFEVVELSLLSIDSKKYPGYRLTIRGQLGQIKQNVSVDIGVGDVVRPKLIDVELFQDKGPLFESSVEVSAYPPESIFAEKLEAIIHLAESNSRMKDYFDCFQIIQNFGKDSDGFKEAIDNTFNNRGTKISFIPDYSEVLSVRWGGFARQNKLNQLELSTVIAEINKFLKKIEIKG